MRNDFNPEKITRPVPALLTYYALVSLASTVAFPFVFLPLYFRYHSLRFRFDEEGISLSWGVLFRKEINLTYRRIQDIHLTRNILQRWMGLANVEIQTASGSSSAEMTIEGVFEAEELRDFLYTKMRGAHGEEHEQPDSSSEPDQALSLLRDIRDELNALTRELKQRGGGEVN